MRPLTEEETKIFFQKLAKYIGRNIKLLLERKDEPYCFRLNAERVYYASEKLVSRVHCVPRKQISCFGVCFGKFSKTKKFKLHITALAVIAPFAQYKVWVKPSAEMSYLYGNHVLKSGLGRITDNTPSNQGVVVYSMSDIPLGFGVTAKSTQECRKLDPTAIVVLNQADIGEYLRNEDSLV
eukprot:TRINITY_DN3381_c0_g2_i1.p1 TRINITY_DN3381_c0_g2~~TRINITY_DN3381_c0_g2_i1.p1  ORF type:complete len:181 (+),score=32.93 TRINITY_DN3381_c0_g2_i1:46-588(+)